MVCRVAVLRRGRRAFPRARCERRPPRPKPPQRKGPAPPVGGPRPPGRVLGPGFAQSRRLKATRSSGDRSVLREGRTPRLAEGNLARTHVQTASNSKVEREVACLGEQGTTKEPSLGGGAAAVRTMWKGYKYPPGGTPLEVNKDDPGEVMQL
ncbi:uncharacterized protein Misfa [Peromyscus maniculatus bairdii]|uniref:uncharacterized protein Misfa n=1 Tax=Peromyscus maniculatus bairdii TaxID=230844 RepID=UPI003FCF6489